MIPPLVQTDRYGTQILIIRSAHLQEFKSLLKWINVNGFSQAGILKLRLHNEDRQDEKCVEEVISTMKHKLNETRLVKGKKKIFSYQPSCQKFLRASINDHIYELNQEDCSHDQRKEFVDEATNASNYKDELNCCTDCLSQNGLQGLKQHFFDTLQKSSDCIDKIRQRLTELKRPYCSSICPVIYGAGISVNPDSPVHLCDQFTMIGFDEVISELDEKFDGISYPFIYSGSVHSAFPWHIEDGGLYSLNYVTKGAKKIWFGIAANHFGLVDQIAQSLRISKSHSSCRAVLLGDHKNLVADPDYFTHKYGVPYTMIVQEEGDFVMTFPYALHAGFNTGKNLAIASNFADIAWIEVGIYAPTCDCYKNQVKFDFTKILKKYRPDLLEMYLDESSLLFPPNHPREVRRIVSVTQQHVDVGVSSHNEQPAGEQSCMRHNGIIIFHQNRKGFISSQDDSESVTQNDVELPLETANLQGPSSNSAFSLFQKMVSSKSMHSKPRRFVSVTQNFVEDALQLSSSHKLHDIQPETNSISVPNNAFCFCQQKSEGLMLFCDLCKHSFHSECVHFQSVHTPAKWFCQWCAKTKSVQEDMLQNFNEKLIQIKDERLLHYKLCALKKQVTKTDILHTQDCKGTPHMKRKVGEFSMGNETKAPATTKRNCLSFMRK